MSTTLAGAALLMGLAGGPHCAAMCGAACGGIVRLPGRRPAPAMLQFQLGRLLGYATLGAVAAQAVGSFAWLAQNTAALQPVWTLFHVAVLGWGLALLLLARQPVWVSAAGRSVWSRVRPLAARRGGVLAAGALWAFMPCGLLYSALLVASLSGSAQGGALAMALFALGSAVSLALAPALLLRLQQAGDRLRRDWGTRAAGGLLVAAAGWSLWMDVAHKLAAWCGFA
ncbi:MULTISPECIES: sulfite exporter TauE/SafE family protein [Ramlibacter]|uniref:Sulfite exporter TauE/SafE family protein n=1 Tax=Ramlibacter aquaticus TaxID=2780094 RepID=A0ABR9SAP9_9BURK|nr:MULTISPECIES: sulfite exporter TauE/SafE family protein [Ramlibacter]MBE7939380.1 sulfite exporter TauE/SafE family protein [Ramlibacter aquaticus]